MKDIWLNSFVSECHSEHSGTSEITHKLLTNNNFRLPLPNAGVKDIGKNSRWSLGCAQYTANCGQRIRHQRSLLPSIRNLGRRCTTVALQAALTGCSLVSIRAGAQCTAQPLTLSSHTSVVIEQNATIKAGAKWATNNSCDGGIQPFILADSVLNVSISGLVDGNGEAWWSDPGCSCLRIHLQDFLLLNSAFWTLLLGGRDFRVSGISKPRRTPMGSVWLLIGCTSAESISLNGDDRCCVIEYNSELVAVLNEC